MTTVQTDRIKQIVLNSLIAGINSSSSSSSSSSSRMERQNMHAVTTMLIQDKLKIIEEKQT